MERPVNKKDAYLSYKIVPLPITNSETNFTLIILLKYPYYEGVNNHNNKFISP